MDEVFSRSHEWARAGDDGIRIGISRHAAEEIGEVAHVGLPQPGDRVGAGDVIAEIESVKSINEICSPVAGTIAAINSTLLDDPTLLNRDPEGSAWLVRLAGDAELAGDGLLSRADYEALVAGER